nr:MAG TPA: hypothetical protein [Caudoviricetes sp.]
MRTMRSGHTPLKICLIRKGGKCSNRNQPCEYLKLRTWAV